MDRGSYQVANIHELLHSTIKMFGDKIGKGKDRPIKLMKEWTSQCPKLLAIPGDLNEVWDIIITTRSRPWTGTAR